MTKYFFVSLLFSSILFAVQPAHYVGDKKCVACHTKENHEWKGSHHDMAMMVADEHSVKADFNNTTFNYNGIISKFYKKNGKFMVETDGPDGKLHKYEIAYTFGIYPLQQYMIKFPDGKIQVLDPTWDNRSKEEGGQRWYHIHKDDNVTAGDPLHWTGPNMNWNYMCADCHSTNLKKNYDVKTKSYNTTWDVINVSCEACHGPASEHLVWSKNKDANVENKGFAHTFKTSTKPWRERSSTLKSLIQTQELNVCAKCHSRRTQIDDDFVAGDTFHEHYLPVNLDNGLYFPDGKIEDEVYVYNSFLQSRMYEEGVTCSDCHNPHSLERKGVGDKVCFSCHNSVTYTASSHHKHKEGSSGASCISCHMPARTYMGVDNRNDHSFRVPRPDISVKIPNVPNACNLCHQDKKAKWAADTMKKWYGKVPVGKQNFSHALQGLRNDMQDAPQSLYDVLTSEAPVIAKATVTGYLGNYPSRQTYTTTLQMLRSKDVMTRRSALQALAGFPPQMKVKNLYNALLDSMKIVRTEAARQLSYFPMGDLDVSSKTLLLNVLDEYKKMLLFTAERPESQLALASIYTNLKEYDKAEKAYLEALRLQKKFVPAYVNYANFLHKSARDKEAYKYLQRGLQEVKNSAAIYHALGLYYTRNQENKKALQSFKKAANLEKNNATYQYVYAVALSQTNIEATIRILEKSLAKHTGDVRTLYALAYYYKKIGDTQKAEDYQQRADAIVNLVIISKIRN